MNIKFQIFFLLIFSLDVFSQHVDDYWVSQNSNHIYSIHDINFFDDYHGCAVSSWGEIVLTNDGGLNWTHKQLNTNVNLYAVNHVTENKIYIAGGYGRVLFSEDGGDTWTEQETNLNDEGTLKDAFFIDSLKGWVVGSRNRIIKTSDGGQTWEVLNSGMTHNPWETEVWFTSVCFINPNKGWIVGGKGTVLKTINGGASWELVDLDITNSLNKIYFKDELNGWILGGYSLYRTNDGGDTWAKVNTPGYSTYLADISFATDKIGWIGGWQGKLLKTTDYGQTWIDVQGHPEGIFAIHFSNGSSGWFTGNGGGIWNYDSDLSVQNNALEKVNIYPNPSNDLINLDLPKSSVGKFIEVFNVHGQIVLTTIISSTHSEINVSKLENGMYYLKIDNQKTKFVKN